METIIYQSKNTENNKNRNEDIHIENKIKYLLKGQIHYSVPEEGC